MSFASWAKMSPRDRMLSALNGRAMPTRGLEFNNANGVRVGAAALNGLGLTIDAGAIMQPSSPGTVTPSTVQSVALDPRLSLTRNITAFEPGATQTYAPAQNFVQPMSTQTVTQPKPVDQRLPSDSATDTGYDKGTYAKGTTDWQAGEPESGSDAYSYSDYEKSGATSDGAKPPVFKIEDRPNPLQVGAKSTAASTGTGGFPWVWLLLAAGGAYFLLKD